MTGVSLRLARLLAGGRQSFAHCRQVDVQLAHSLLALFSQRVGLSSLALSGCGFGRALLRRFVEPTDESRGPGHFLPCLAPPSIGLIAKLLDLVFEFAEAQV